MTETLEKVGGYRIVREQAGIGLIYKKPITVERDGEPVMAHEDIRVLAPVHGEISIGNRDADRSFLYAKAEATNSQGLQFIENNCLIVTADGKKGLLYHDVLCPGVVFAAITKLTYRHYLCYTQNRCTLYRFSDIGYENVRVRQYFYEMHTFEKPPQGVTLTYLWQVLAAQEAEMAADVADLLYQQPGTDRWICDYRYFSGYVDDHEFTAAVQRMIVADDLSLRPLDYRYGVILRSSNPSYYP